MTRRLASLNAATRVRVPGNTARPSSQYCNKVLKKCENPNKIFIKILIAFRVPPCCEKMQTNKLRQQKDSMHTVLQYIALHYFVFKHFSQGWASVLFKRTFRSLRSFPFFIKERSDLCILFCFL